MYKRKNKTKIKKHLKRENKKGRNFKVKWTRYNKYKNAKHNFKTKISKNNFVANFLF